MPVADWLSPISQFPAVSPAWPLNSPLADPSALLNSPMPPPISDMSALNVLSAFIQPPAAHIGASPILPGPAPSLTPTSSFASVASSSSSSTSSIAPSSGSSRPQTLFSRLAPAPPAQALESVLNNTHIIESAINNSQTASPMMMHSPSLSLPASSTPILSSPSMPAPPSSLRKRPSDDNLDRDALLAHIEDRRRRNIESAKRSRERKARRLEELEQNHTVYMKRIEELEMENAKLKSQLVWFEKQFGQMASNDNA